MRDIKPGNVYGGLAVVRAVAGRRWCVRCRCGVVLYVRARQLGGARGLRACGQCGEPPAVEKPRDWQGASRTGEYVSWEAMRRRCADTSNPHYGGRGITVCARWVDDFEAFRSDLGPRPPGTSLDRVNVHGHYEPGNVRWATAKVQGRNTRVNRTVTAFGQTLCLAGWSDLYGVPPGTIAGRLDAGWPPESAVSTPP